MEKIALCLLGKPNGKPFVKRMHCDMAMNPDASCHAAQLRFTGAPSRRVAA